MAGVAAPPLPLGMSIEVSVVPSQDLDKSMHADPMSCGPMGVSPSVPPSHAADVFICSARSSSSRSLVSLACSAGWLKQSRYNELCAYDIHILLCPENN